MVTNCDRSLPSHSSVNYGSNGDEHDKEEVSDHSNCSQETIDTKYLVNGSDKRKSFLTQTECVQILCSKIEKTEGSINQIWYWFVELPVIDVEMIPNLKGCRKLEPNKSRHQDKGGPDSGLNNIVLFAERPQSKCTRHKGQLCRNRWKWANDRVSCLEVETNMANRSHGCRHLHNAPRWQLFFARLWEGLAHLFRNMFLHLHRTW